MSEADCIVVRDPALAFAQNTWFEGVATFVDNSHFSRGVVRCRCCATLYATEWLEEIDWDDGDDPWWSCYAPVRSVEEARAQLSDPPGLWFAGRPRLLRDFPKGAKAVVMRWVDGAERTG